MKDFYHVGMVVSDINAAMCDYKRYYNVTFACPATTQLRVLNPITNLTEEVELTVTYSRGGPPYLEFIQAVGQGIFSEKNAGKILYYGVWEKNIDQRIERLNQAKLGVDALVSEGDLPISAIITAPNPLGARVEYVTTALQGYVRAWTLTGKAPGSDRFSTVLAEVFSVYYVIKNIFR